MGAFAAAFGGATLGSLVVRVLADTDKFVAGLSKGKEGLTGFDGWVQRNSQSLKQLGTITAAAGAAIVGALALMTRESIRFNESFIGIEKTAGPLTEKQLPEIRRQIIQLSKDIPVSTAVLNELGKTAGQVGADGARELMALVHVGAMLESTTNLQGAEAIAILKRTSDILQLTTDDTIRFANGLVHLGNNINANEAEIAEMLRNLAPSAKMMHLNADETLGWAGALTSLGMRPAAVSTAFLNMQRQVTGAVDNGGERLERFAEVAGLSAEEFARQWKETPGAALRLVIKGLYDLEKQGGSVQQSIDRLFNKTGEGDADARLTKIIGAAATGFVSLEKALGYASEGMRENKALTEEASRAWGTTSAHIDRMKNNVRALSRTLGDTLEPIVRSAVDATSDLADEFDRLAQESPTLATGVTMVGGGIGSLALAAGGAMLSMPFLNATAVAFGITTGALALTLVEVAGALAVVALGVGAVVVLLKEAIENSALWMEAQKAEQKALEAEAAFEEKLQERKIANYQEYRLELFKQRMKDAIDAAAEEMRIEGKLTEDKKREYEIRTSEYLAHMEKFGAAQEEVAAKRVKINNYIITQMESAESKHIAKVEANITTELQTFERRRVGLAESLGSTLTVYKAHNDSVRTMLKEINDGHTEQWEVLQGRLKDIKNGIVASYEEANQAEKLKLTEGLQIVQNFMGRKLEEYSSLEKGVKEALSSVLGSLDRYKDKSKAVLDGNASMTKNHLKSDLQEWEAYENDMSDLLSSVNAGNTQAWGKFKATVKAASDKVKTNLTDLATDKEKQLSKVVEITDKYLGLTAKEYQDLDADTKRMMSSMVMSLEEYGNSVEKEMTGAADVVEHETDRMKESALTAASEIREVARVVRSMNISAYNLYANRSEDYSSELKSIWREMEEEASEAGMSFKDFEKKILNGVGSEAEEQMRAKAREMKKSIDYMEEEAKRYPKLRLDENWVKTLETYKEFVRGVENGTFRSTEMFRILRENLALLVFDSSDSMDALSAMIEGSFGEIEQVLDDAVGHSWLVDNARKFVGQLETMKQGSVGFRNEVGQWRRSASEMGSAVGKMNASTMRVSMPGVEKIEAGVPALSVGKRNYKNGIGQSAGNTIHSLIDKIADTVVIKETADADRIMNIFESRMRTMMRV